MSEDQETKNELSTESTESSEHDESGDCLACDALSFFCTTIDDPDAKEKCAISVKAVQEGILDAGEARTEIMGIIGEEAYEDSVGKTNDWISDRFEKTREIMQEAAKGAEMVESVPIDVSEKILPEETNVPDVAIDKSDKFLSEEV